MPPSDERAPLTLASIDALAALARKHGMDHVAFEAPGGGRVSFTLRPGPPEEPAVDAVGRRKAEDQIAFAASGMHPDDYLGGHVPS